jgi:N-acetylneuraminic acid mutarotase
VTGNATAPRSGALAFLLPDQTVLVVGGLSSGGLDTDRYNPATGTWSPGPQALFPHPDAPAGVRLQDGRILVTGGRLNGTALAHAEIFNPATNTWSATGSMTSPRVGHTLTLLANGKVLATGGWNGGFISSAEVFDPAAGTWTATSSMSEAKWLHSATLLSDGRVLVAGGENYTAPGGPHFRETAYWDPATGAWTAGPLLNTGRADHEAAGLPDGRVVVIGGLSGFAVNSALASIEIFDGAIWQFGAPMSDGRFHFPLAVMQDGSLLVTGGTTANTSPQTVTAGAERYDPASGAWSSGGVMNAARRMHTATTLANGHVLVTGGSNAANSLISSEIMGDLIAPQTTATRSVQPNIHGWNNGDVTVTLQAADNAGGSGVHSITYALSGAQNGGATVAGDTVVLPITAEGSTAIRFQARDVEGNVEAEQAILVNIDRIAPLVSPPNNITIAATAGGTVVEFAPSVIENGSGIASLTSAPFASGMRFPAGTTHVTITAIDKAGHAAAAGFDVTVVPSPPVITVTGGEFEVDGQPHPATAVAVDRLGAPVTGTFNITYFPGGAAAPTGVGRYGASATFTSNDPGILNASPWNTMAADPHPKSSPAAVMIDGKVYVHGFDQDNAGNPGSFVPRLSIYDPSANTWTVGASPAIVRSYVSVGVLNGKMYVAGGCVMSDCRIGVTNAVEIYDPVANSWSNGPSLLTGRYAAAAGVINGRLYVVGGTLACPPCNTTSVNERLNPDTNTWTAHAAIPVSHEQPASAVVNGLLYVISGFQRDPLNPLTGAMSARVDVYDPGANSWSQRAAMPAARMGAASGVLNGAIHVVGGNGGSGHTAIQHRYDPSSDTWTEGPPMAALRSNAAGAVAGSRLYVLDGSIGIPLGTNEVFDPSLTTQIAIVEAVNVPPTASFIANPNPAACLQPVSFDASASAAGRPDRSIVNYSWDFGDGTPVSSGMQVSLNHSFAGFGSYTVTLTVTDNSVPALSSSASQTITISQGNLNPVANPGGPYMFDLGAAAQLDGTNSFEPNANCGDSIVEYRWTIDNTLVLIGATPMLSAAQVDALGAGFHSVSLQVTDEFGSTNTAFTSLSIFNNVPTAQFSANPNPAACQQAVSFNGSGSSAGRPDRSIVNYSWDFGDGTPIVSGMQSSLNHSYAAFGSYTATLTVTDNNVPAKSASMSLPISVSQGNMPPFANAGGPYTVNSGEAVQLNGANSTDPNAACGDSIVSYEWTIAGTIQLQGPAPLLDTAAHNLAPGNHNVSLRVTDEFGTFSTTSTSVNVQRVLVSVSVSPASATVSPGQNQMFQAIGHFNDGTTQVLPNANQGGGNGAGVFGPSMPRWSVQFLTPIDVSACATPQTPAQISFSTQGLQDRNGVVDENWSPITPVLDVDGSINPMTVNLTLKCTSNAQQGSIVANWTGNRYEGMFVFGTSKGAVEITGWSAKTPMPAARFSAAAAAVDGTVYVFGGSNPGVPQDVYAYTPPTNSWQTVGQMATPREGAGAAALNGRVFVVGGHVSGGAATGLTEVFDPVNNSWIELASLSTPRAHHAVVTDGTYIYAIGGDTLNNNGGIVASVERYNPASNQWSALPPMPGAGNFISAGVLDGTIVVAGAGGNGGPSNATYVYDIAGQSWRNGPSMPASRAMTSAGVVNGGLYLFGGTINGAPAFDTWVYYPPKPAPDPRPEYWSSVGPILTARSQAAAAVSGDVLYALGGMVPGSNPATQFATNESLTTPPAYTYAPFQGGGGSPSLPAVQWNSSNQAVANIDGGGSAHANALGVTTISATTSTGLSCTTSNTCATLTVVDTQPPMLNVPNNSTREATGPGGALVTFTVSAFDNIDGPRPVTCDRQSNTMFPFGPTTVECSASDLSGNTATRSFTITVVDTKPPFLNVPNFPFETEATSPNGAMVSFSQGVFANDQVDGNVIPVCNPPSGSQFPIGQTIVTCTATDSRGNQSAPKSFTVLVTDPPQVNLPADLVAEATSAAGASVAFTVTASNFLEGPLPVQCFRILGFDGEDPIIGPPVASGEVFPLGTNTVGCRSFNAAGDDDGGFFTITVVDTTAPVVGLVSPGVDDFVLSSPAPVTVEVIEAVGITSVTINGVAAMAAGVTPAGTLWTADVPSVAGAALALTVTATDTSGHTTNFAATVDNDGIDSEIDRSRSTGADQSAVFSSEFNDGMTRGTITRLNNARVRATRSGSAVGVTLATAGAAHVNACTGNLKYVVLDEQGEGADLSCADTGTITVTAQTATPAGKVELYKSTPGDVLFAQLRCFFLPLRFRYSAQCSPSPSPVSYYYSYQVKLRDGDTASTGSPVVASPGNTRPIEVELLQIDDQGNEVPVGGFVLDPGESADVSITPGADRNDHIVVSALSGDVEVTIGHDTETVGEGTQSNLSVNLTPPPPVVTGAGVTAEATSPDGAVVTFEVSAVDAVGAPLPVTCTPPSGSTFPIGQTVVSCAATDSYGTRTEAALTVTVVDTTAPTITQTAASHTSLWPPTHTMTPITIAAAATDIADAAPVCEVAGVVSSEPINGLGDGDTAPDWTVTGGLTLDLRAERAAKGPGRVYTITVSCVDASGNAATAQTEVTVGHNQ